MSSFPAVTGKEIVAALGRLGFEVLRTKGSHQFLRHPDGRTTVVPTHSGEDLGPGLLAKILRDAKVDRETLRQHL